VRWLAVIFVIGVTALTACSSSNDHATTAPTRTLTPKTTIQRSSAGTPAQQTPQHKPYIVAISAGHGGPDNIGAVHHNAAGQVDLVEKDLNLDIALRLDKLLRAAGDRTVLIRDGDYSLAQTVPGDFTESVRRESQARTDKANAAGADILLLIHSNGSEDAKQSGTEVYYNPDRSFGEKNKMLATYTYQSIIESLRSIGYETHARGIMNDTSIGQRFGVQHTFTLGESEGFRASQMPGIIMESLFVTNDREAELLQRDDVRNAIAQGYKGSVDRYFAWRESSGQ
jgi:N-acetylmuramoyl-L-alanine amidase